MPALPGVITPRWDLQGFSRVWVDAGQATSLSWTLSAVQLSTVLTNGTRVNSPGLYTVWVGGHQPEDALGVSNVVSANFTLAALTK